MTLHPRNQDDEGKDGTQNVPQPNPQGPLGEGETEEDLAAAFAQLGGDGGATGGAATGAIARTTGERTALMQSFAETLPKGKTTSIIQGLIASQAASEASQMAFMESTMSEMGEVKAMLTKLLTQQLQATPSTVYTPTHPIPTGSMSGPTDPAAAAAAAAAAAPHTAPAQTPAAAAAGPALHTTPAVLPGATATATPQTILHVKTVRKIEPPKFRLEKTSTDLEAYKLELHAYIADCTQAGIMLTEESKIQEAKKMIGPHTGSGEYYTHAMEWQGVGSTLAEFLESVEIWHQARRKELDPVTRAQSRCTFDVFQRPLGVKMRTWMTSPYLRYHLRTKFRRWPDIDFAISKVMDTLISFTCHRSALAEYLISEDGTWGYTWDIAKIRAEQKTPEHLIAYLERWVELNSLLEAEFQREQKKRVEKQTKEMNEHISKQEEDKSKFKHRTVMAVDEADEEYALATGTTYRRSEVHPKSKITPPLDKPCPICLEKTKKTYFHPEAKCYHVTGWPSWFPKKRRSSASKNAEKAEK